MTEAAPLSDDEITPHGFAGRLLTLIGRVAGLPALWLAPQSPDTSWRGPHMELRLRERLRAQIRHVEYALRCYILWLAAQLISRGVSLPAPMRRCTTSTPYDPEAPSAYLCKLDRQLRSDEAEIPPATGFTVVFPDTPGNTRSKGRASRYRLQPDPLMLVEAAPLLARLNALPNILKRADLMAERLASKALHSEASQANAKTLQPLSFPPLGHWMPPEAIYEAAGDDAERSDLNRLHFLASSALDEAGFGVPPPDGSPLPALTRFQPPSIRQI